jgi:hypothetical protein
MKASKRLCMLLMRMRLYHARIDVFMQPESPVSQRMKTAA